MYYKDKSRLAVRNYYIRQSLLGIQFHRSVYRRLEIVAIRFLIEGVLNSLNGVVSDDRLGRSCICGMHLDHSGVEIRSGFISLLLF